MMVLAVVLRNKTLDMALDIKQDLILSGFVPKVEKCLWVPVQSLRFLGANIDSRESYLTIPENRIEKTLNTLAEIKRDVESREKVFVRKIASFVGQIISMAIVIGNVSLIMTKSLSYDIKEANTWFSCIILSEESKVQLEFWQENIKHLNCKRMFSVHSFSKIIFSDASSTGLAGYQVAILNGVSHGMWAPDEVLKSSTWRELSAVHRVLHSFAKSLRNSKVKWYSDNAAVCSIVSKGSMKRELQRLALDIFSLCIQYSIHLELEWLPRELNDKSDYFSRIWDFDDWGIAAVLFEILSKKWGPFAVDWFASDYNAKVEQFYTRFWSEKSTGVDAFMENWGNCNGYFVPPISQISEVILHMKKKCKAFGVIVLPYWESAPFWPLICENKGKFKSCVQDCIDLPTEKMFYTPCRSGEGIFGNQNLKFRMLALRICF